MSRRKSSKDISYFVRISFSLNKAQYLLSNGTQHRKNPVDETGSIFPSSPSQRATLTLQKKKRNQTILFITIQNVTEHHKNVGALHRLLESFFLLNLFNFPRSSMTKPSFLQLFTTPPLKCVTPKLTYLWKPLVSMNKQFKAVPATNLPINNPKSQNVFTETITTPSRNRNSADEVC